MNSRHRIFRIIRPPFFVLSQRINSELLAMYGYAIAAEPVMPGSIRISMNRQFSCSAATPVEKVVAQESQT